MNTDQHYVWAICHTDAWLAHNNGEPETMLIGPTSLDEARKHAVTLAYMAPLATFEVRDTVGDVVAQPVTADVRPSLVVSTRPSRRALGKRGL